MTRTELLQSKEYWTAEVQLQLFDLINNYIKEHKLTKVQLAEKLGVSKSYISQVLNGDFDHKVSKLVELSLACGKIPIIHYVDTAQYILDDAQNKKHIYKTGFKPVQYNTISVSFNEQKLPIDNASTTVVVKELKDKPSEQTCFS